MTWLNYKGFKYLFVYETPGTILSNSFVTHKGGELGDRKELSFK